MYPLLRAAAGFALRWYYRDIQVEGLERVPRGGPLLLVVNHPNALVDALLVGWVVPRRVLITAKATLFTNPIAAALLRWLGVLPLRRASDERASSERSDPRRNVDTFRAVHNAFVNDGTVLIFPEGKTPDEPSLAPLKTGAARMALAARDSGDARGLSILPIGLTFERKEKLRSRVFVQIGEPIAVDEWCAADGGTEPDALTADIEARLRALTLSYATLDDAARAVRLASVIAALFEPVPEIGVVDRGLAAETRIAARIASFNGSLENANDELRARVDDVVRRIEALEAALRARHLRIEDVRISLESRAALGFMIRESWIVLAAGPFALWGRINHWIPFRFARAVAMRRIQSASDPAMNTMIAGAAFVTLAYLAQTLAVAWLFGPIAGAVYLVSLPVAADVNFYLSDRLRRALERARAFLFFRRHPDQQRELTADVESLRRDIASLAT
jgi:glycerol-3-phosphate O-acyltransferase / dihydroxyacetone phosphate acyltransferase